MPKYADGEEKTNPATGEVWVVRGGTWVLKDDSGTPLSGASISTTPKADQPISLMPWLPKDTPQPHLPSLISLLEAVPGLGGALGAAGGIAATPHAGGSGAVPGAILGSGLGEAVRQDARKALGYVPATGNVAEGMGLDPSSEEASGVGMLAEMFGGGGAENVMARLLGKTPGMRKSARRMFAGILDRSGREQAVRRIEKKLIPIEDVLPVGSRGRIERVATKGAEDSTEILDELYGKQPSSYVPAYDELSREAESLVKTPIHTKKTVNKAGEVAEETVQPFIKNKRLHKELRKEAERLREAQQKASSFEDLTGEGGVTRADVRDLRMQAGDDAILAKKSIFDPAGSSIKQATPRSRALVSEQKALSNILHGDEFGAGEAGKKADAIFSGWKTIEKGAVGEDPGMFPVRWMISRMVGGRVGSIGGFAATKPAFWSSISSKGMRTLANMIENGSEAEAEHLLRTFVRDYENVGAAQ